MGMVRAIHKTTEASSDGLNTPWNTSKLYTFSPALLLQHTFFIQLIASSPTPSFLTPSILSSLSNKMVISNGTNQALTKTWMCCLSSVATGNTPPKRSHPTTIPMSYVTKHPSNMTRTVNKWKMTPASISLFNELAIFRDKWSSQLYSLSNLWCRRFPYKHEK